MGIKKVKLIEVSFTGGQHESMGDSGSGIDS